MTRRFKLFNHLFFFGCFKIRQAVGIKSECKDGKHLILVDIDHHPAFRPQVASLVSNYLERKGLSPFTIYPTKNGIHFIVWRKFKFEEAAHILIDIPFIDLGWVAIGLKRGYWFLETPHRITPLASHVQFMKIERSFGDIEA